MSRPLYTLLAAQAYWSILGVLVFIVVCAAVAIAAAIFGTRER